MDTVSGRGAPVQAPRPAHNEQKLALRELETLTSALLAVLLALVLPGIARQKASLLQRAAELDIELNQSAGNTETNRPGLANDAAAIRQNQHVEPFLHLNRAQRLLHRNAGGFRREIILKRPAIHGDLSRSRPQEHAGDTTLAPPRPQILLDFL